jgi:hypothetical protein
MSITIRGHKLPLLLCQLIEEGKWHPLQELPRKEFYSLLNEAGVRQFPVVMIDVQEMNHDGLVDLYQEGKTWIRSQEELEEQEKIYGMASSKKVGTDIEEIFTLDIDNAVCIALNTDEDLVYLDYRLNPDNPRVLASEWIDEEGNKWRVIAPDFETFARKLGLIE